MYPTIRYFTCVNDWWWFLPIKVNTIYCMVWKTFDTSGEIFHFCHFWQILIFLIFFAQCKYNNYRILSDPELCSAQDAEYLHKWIFYDKIPYIYPSSISLKTWIYQSTTPVFRSKKIKNDHILTAFKKR